MEKRISTLLILLFAGLGLLAQPVITIDYKCDSARLSYVAPDDGMVYYWQGTSCGESLDDDSPTFKVTASGTYYLRAFNTTSSTWAATDCSTAIVALAQYPAEPPVPVYESGTLVLPEPPAPLIYYAQGTSCGNSTDSPGFSFPVSASGTYYFNAFDTVFNCWSQECTSVNLIISDVDHAVKDRIKIILSPVPASDHLRISLPENVSRVNLDIYDQTGRLVLSKKDLTTQDAIDISSLTRGSYFARFRGKSLDESQKFIIYR